MKIFLQGRISKALMRMMKNFPQVGILKVVKMIMPMVVTLSRVGNYRQNVGDEYFPPSEDFQGIDEDDEDFPPSEDFQGTSKDDE
jgi:hypothetical protein